MTAMTVLPVGAPSVELCMLSSRVAEYVEVSDLTRLSAADLVAELRALETLRRQLQACDHPMVAELDRRGLGASFGARSTAGLLADVLRLSPGDAKARVTAGRDLGPRPTFGSGMLAPTLPAAASSHTAGAISSEHVREIVAVMQELPSTLPVQDYARADQILTQVAEHCKPREVANAGLRLLDTVDPDRHPPTDHDRQRLRHLGLRRRRDGSYEISGRLTPECGAETEAVLNAFAAPRPAVDDHIPGPSTDDRTAAQRMHDALQDVVGLALRADTTENIGRQVQLVLTGILVADTAVADTAVSETAVTGTAVSETAVTGTAVSETAITEAAGSPVGPTSSGCREEAPSTATLGRIAWTSFGQAISMQTAMRLCDTALVAAVTTGASGEVLNYGQTRRFATRAQIRALTARDGGCSFPGCDHPPQWCDAHHIVAWIDGGPTALRNLTMVCGYHHRNFQRLGWICQISNGIPQWIPPPHIDPSQTPRLNIRYLLR